jgi:multiple sugar transport system permease protein
MEAVLTFLRGRTVIERRARIGYLFVLPSLFFVLILFVIPAIYDLVLSVSEWSIARPMSFVGLENYQSVFADRSFWYSLQRTTYFTALSVPVAILLALVAALGFHRVGQRPGTALVRALYFMPVVASLTAVAYIWMWIFNPYYGILNQALTFFGLPQLQWLGNQRQVIPALSIMYIWSRLGFNMLILLAGLNSIPRDYYEAAEIDGANSWQAFRNVTLPLLNRQLVLVAVVEVANALKVFALPYAATGGGPVDASRSLVMIIFDLGFKWSRMGESAVVSTALFALILTLTLLQRRLFTRQVEV